MTSKFYKAEAIILRRKNTGEADRILTAFTKEYGKLRLLAKGVRRITSRRGPHLEIFSRSVILIHRGKIMDSVGEAAAIDTFENLRRDVRRVSLGYFFCELVDTMTAEKQEHADIFALLTRSFAKLNDKHISSIYQLSRQFSLELLWGLGFLPQTKTLGGPDLASFIENVSEKHLKSPHFARIVASW